MYQVFDDNLFLFYCNKDEVDSYKAQGFRVVLHKGKF